MIFEDIDIEEVLSNLEVVVIEEVLALRAARKSGASTSPTDIAIGYLSPCCGDGQQLSQDSHTIALACMVAVTLHWLASQECETA